MDRFDRERGLFDREKGLDDKLDSFNPIFPSLQNVSEDSGPRNFLDTPSPYRLNANTTSDEALKQIRTANSVSISPGMHVRKIA